MWTKSVLMLVLIGVALAVERRADACIPEAEGTATGDAVILEVRAPSGDAHMFLLIDHDQAGRGPDGNVDRVFRLQREDHDGEAFQGQFARATVRWSRSSVHVASLDGRDFTLAVRRRNDGDGGNTFVGFGLAHFAGPRVELPDQVFAARNFDALRVALGDYLAWEEETCVCVAGGPGAEACSVSGCPQPPTSCSVECGNELPCCGCLLDEEPDPPVLGHSCCYCKPPD